MVKGVQWNDDYWLLLLQVYLQKPIGVKPLYSKKMVSLAIELHIHPQTLYNKMCALDRLETPRLERIWDKYSNNPDRLARAAKLLREMQGFSHADAFYEGVEMKETFEVFFRPIEGCAPFSPLMLTLILDLYFRLTPITMVEQTPEVVQLSRQLQLKPCVIVEVLRQFQSCDPWLRRQPPVATPLVTACRQVWQDHGNGNPEHLSTLAAQLMAFWNKK